MTRQSFCHRACSAEEVVVTDLDGGIEYVNPAIERITGYSRVETIGEKTSLLKSGPNTFCETINC
ncbi:MAG: PAS domain S-box protein [Desulfobulbaceae bacterium]|nr:PAS domain S-box protein [Desulfobulbaceae bacterium]